MHSDKRYSVLALKFEVELLVTKNVSTLYSNSNCSRIVLIANYVITCFEMLLEGVVAQWCNALTLPPEQSGGVGSILGRVAHLSVMTMGRGFD